MVAHNTVRIYKVNQVFRFVEGIWLHRQSRKIPISLHTCATCTELQSYLYNIIGVANGPGGPDRIRTALLYTASY